MVIFSVGLTESTVLSFEANEQNQSSEDLARNQLFIGRKNRRHSRKTRRASVAEPDPRSSQPGFVRPISDHGWWLVQLAGTLLKRADMRGITEYCESMNVPNNMVEIIEGSEIGRWDRVFFSSDDAIISE